MMRSKTVSRSLWVVVVAALIALVGVFALSQATVASAAPDEPNNVETWDELVDAVAAVEEGGVVTITQDLTAEKSIEIGKKVVVKSEGGKTIYRKAGATDFPVFTVNNGGDLELRDVALSGYVKSMQPGTTCDTHQVTALQVVGGTDDGKYIQTTGDADENAWKLVDDASSAEWEQLSVAGGEFEFQPKGHTDRYLTSWDSSGNITVEERRWVSGQSTHFKVDNNGYLEGASFGATWWDADGLRNGNHSNYSQGNVPKVKFVTVDVQDDPSCIPSDETWGNPQCGDYDADSLESGSAANPAGFFIKVNNGGIATLGESATLSDFVTKGDVFYIAPVVVDGGEFNMVPGATIKDNSVGYTADNSKSGEAATTIGSESELGDGEEREGSLLREWNNTETAGAVIYTNGSKGDLSGGMISNNRGDTGAVVVQGSGASEPADLESVVSLSGTRIEQNAGVHHAGALYIYNGADVVMKGGTLKNNFAWNKGGAVWVSEEVYASGIFKTEDDGQPSNVPVAAAKFTMQDGTIDGNMAVNRGGGIEVMSNHVALASGAITNNTSRVLGGGIYVEGDPGKIYQLFIQSGCITDNTASKVGSNTNITRTFTNNSNDCGFVNDITTNPSQATGDVTWNDGFWGSAGDGGGIWMCAFGGNTTFGIENGSTVNGNNYESRGKDIFVTLPAAGSASGVNIVSLGGNEFEIEGTDIQVAEGSVYPGELSLKNTNPGTCAEGGVTISGNVASNGGGIAANGTVVFGKANTYRAATSLELTKQWSNAIPVEERKDVRIDLFAENAAGKQAQIGESVILNGKQDTLVIDRDPEGIDEFDQNASAFESDSWVAKLSVPLTATIDDEIVSLFTFDVDGKTLDPSKLTDLAEIYEGVANGTITEDNLKVNDWQFVVKETIDEEEQEYVLPLGDTPAVAIEALPGNEVTYDQLDVKLGNYPVAISFANTIGNDVEPQIEKYVNNNVHADIVVTDTFTYDILAYVPLDADSIKITDTLDSQLVFVDDEATIAKSAVVKETNDHTVGGTVAQDGGTEIEAKATISNQNLTVEVAKAEAARGKYIQVTFSAKVKDGTKAADVKLGDKPVTDNGPVLGGSDSHQGVENTASYQIDFGNGYDSESKHDSNTVTVKPKDEKPAIEKYVNKVVHEEIDIADTFTYDILAYVTRDADSVVVTDKLNEQLQFVSKETDVKVASLGEEVDHKPNGSVAKDGEQVNAAQAKISGDTLTVTIDDAKALRGQWIKVTFDAKIKDGLTVSDLKYTPITENTPVLTDEEHEGVPNNASYTIKVGNDANAYSDTSNTVTVKPKDTKPEEPKPSDEDGEEPKPTPGGGDGKPEPQPETETPAIEKYVNKDVHKDIAIDEVFASDVLVYVPEDADTIEIRDVLDGELAFADDADTIAQTAVVKDTNDHKVNGTVAATDGTSIEATATIEGQILTVSVPNATAARGKWIQVTFNARVADDKTEDDVKGAFKTIDSNTPVLGGAATHTGVPNTADYRIGCKDSDGNVTYDTYANGNADGWNSSNTVTVAPKSSEDENGGTGNGDNNQSGNNEEDDGTGRNLNQSPNTTRTPGSVSASPTTSTARSATATARPTTSTVVRGLSQTADDMGPAIYGLAALAILAFGAGAISLRRNRKDAE